MAQKTIAPTYSPPASMQVRSRFSHSKSTAFNRSLLLLRRRLLFRPQMLLDRCPRDWRPKAADESESGPPRGHMLNLAPRTDALASPVSLPHTTKSSHFAFPDNFRLPPSPYSPSSLPERPGQPAVNMPGMIILFRQIRLFSQTSPSLYSPDKIAADFHHRSPLISILRPL
jgi:hypothetical protein